MKIEQEYRFALTAEEYDRLRMSLGEPLHLHRQRNHYFDTTAEDLCRRGFGLRLREQEGRYRLAWKGPDQATAEEASVGISRRREEEHEIPTQEARTMLEEGAVLGQLEADLVSNGFRMPAEIESLRGDRVRTIGWVETERATYALSGEACLELDRVRFSDGRIDHELEVEWSGGDGLSLGQRLRAWLTGLGIEARPQPETKLARFFRYRA